MVFPWFLLRSIGDAGVGDVVQRCAGLVVDKQDNRFRQGFGGDRSVTGASISQTRSLTTLFMGTNDTTKNQYLNHSQNELALAIGISIPS